LSHYFCGRQIQEVVRHVPRLEIVDVPVVRHEHVPRVEIQTIEQIRQIPVPQIVDVPVEHVVQVPAGTRRVTDERHSSRFSVSYKRLLDMWRG